jgi:hypothetical protein
MVYKNIFLGLILIVSIVSLSWSFLKKLNKPKIDLTKIERMVDTRDPKTITGSVWTAMYDCTYKNPPKENTLIMMAVSCEATTHNVEVLESGDIFFTPRSTFDDKPPFCLVNHSGDATSISVAKDRQYAYCFKQWKKQSFWQRIFN